MKKISKRVISFVLAFVMVVGLLPISKTSVAKAEGKEVKVNKGLRPELQEKLPLYGGYYRTWHDVTSFGIKRNENGEQIIKSDGSVAKESNGGLARMDKIPNGVDLVFVFDDWQHPESPFYEKLKTDYAPTLQKRGTKVIRTIGTEFLYGATGIAKDKFDYYTNDEEGYLKLARDIVNKYVIEPGLDGLDIDVELHNYSPSIVQGEKRERLHGVLKALGTLIGPNGEYSDKLFIYDTTLGPEIQAFQENYHNFDLVLLQRYGFEGVVGKWDTETNTRYDNLEQIYERFGQYVSYNQIMIGFTNYEENAPTENRWYDVPLMDGTVQIVNDKGKTEIEIGGLAKSRAGYYSKWQPSKGLKAGIFVYAIERDDVLHPTKGYAGEVNPKRDPIKTQFDVKLPTEYRQSVALMNMQDSTDEYKIIDENEFKDPVLLNLVKNKVSKFKGDITRYTGKVVIDDPKITDLSGIELLKNANIIIKNLQNVNSIDLSNRNLELLEIENPENLKSLKKLDISNNHLDLSYNTNNRKILDALLVHLRDNNDGNVDEKVLNISNQIILGHYPEKLETDVIKYTVKKGEVLELTSLLGKTYTKSKTDISTPELFSKLLQDQIEGVKYFNQDTTFESVKKDYSKFKFDVHDSTQGKITDGKIDLSFDETYFVKVLNDQKVKYTVKVVIGEEKEQLENLALNAKSPIGPPINDKLFNGVIDYPPALLGINAPHSIIFRLENNAEISHIRLYNVSAGTQGKPQNNDLENVRFEVLAETKDVDSMSYLEKEKYLNNDDNWKVVAEMTEAKDVYSQSIETTNSRYWRLSIDTARNGATNNSYPSAAELQLLGKRIEKPVLNLENLQKSIEKASTIDRKYLKQEDIQNLDKELVEANNLLKNDKVKQEELDKYSEKISALVEELMKKSKIFEKESQDQKLKEEREALIGKVENLEKEKEAQHQKLKELEKEKAENAKEIEILKTEFEKLKSESEKVKKELKDKKSEFAKKEKDLNDQIKRLFEEKSKLEKSNEEVQQNLNNKIKELEKEKAENAKEIENLKAEVERVKSEEEKAKKELKDKESESAKKVKDLDEQIKKLSKEKADAENSKKESEQNLNNKLKELEEKLKDNSNKKSVVIPWVSLTPAIKTELNVEAKKYTLGVEDINKKLEEVSKDLYDILSGEYKGGFESEIKEIGFVNKAGEKVTKFDTPMDVFLELKSLKLTDKDTLRVFHIGENGVDEVKDVKVDGQKVMFKSATFSPFVFVKGDKIAEAGNTGSAIGTPAQGSQQNTDTQVQSTGTTNPETGDSGIMTYAIMAVVAVVALGGMVVVKKRTKNN